MENTFPPQLRRPANSRKDVPARFYIAIIALCLILSGFLFMQYWRLRSELANLKSNSPAASIPGEGGIILERVGKLTVLPSGETPTIATVTDKNKLKDQHFFDQAMDGDKVIMYSKSKLIIVYRPSLNKVVAVGPVSSQIAP